MRIERLAAMAAMLLAPGAAIAVPQPPSRAALTAVLGDIDRRFVCPEFLPDDAARQAELAAFGRSLSGLKLSYAQASYIRAKMLDRHNCAGGMTLRTADNAKPPATAPVPIQEASIAPPGTGLPH